MTALQLNAELFRAMGKIADDETLMKKVLNYVKRLAAKKEDPTLMTKEEFFAKVDKSKAQYERGEYTRFSNEDEMVKWLNSL
jgi:uncharacterized short protein YbdD (DUF466 family)